MKSEKSEKPKKVQRKPKERDANYISPKQFDADILSYYAACIHADEFSDNDSSALAKKARRAKQKALDVCGISLHKMAIGLTKNWRFILYTWHDNMVSNAMIKCIKALVGRKYDPLKGMNPFSYFNAIAFNEFRSRITYEKKHLNTLNDYKSMHYTDFAKDSDVPIYVKPLFNDRVNDIDLWDDDNAN